MNHQSMNHEQPLRGKRIAILATDGVEQEELTSPILSLEAAGAETEILSLKPGTIRGWKHTDWGDDFPVDIAVADAFSEDYDAVVLPGGVLNPDALRQDQAVLTFLKEVAAAGKVIGAICHGPWPLIDARLVEGRQMTSYRSIRTDLMNAGAEWVDEEVVVDGGLVTSRTPDDLPAFNRRLIEVIARGDLQPARKAQKPFMTEVVAEYDRTVETLADSQHQGR